MNQPLVVLGATGSIGVQALEVAQHLEIAVDVMAARHPSDHLAELARMRPDTTVVVAGGSSGDRSRFAEGIPNQVEFGSDAVEAAARIEDRTVVNGIVGAAGLKATVAALESGNRVALANKESLVAGGPVVRSALARGGGELIPVDSEHSAIFQCLLGEPRASVRRIVLTASGGPFRGRRAEDLADVTPEDALAHPTWDMGHRITIDSATLFNKGLEVVEAHFLFDLDFDLIDVVVHPQSIVHSAVEFVDGSLKAHVGHPDMRVPIQYALTFPHRAASTADEFSFVGRELTFEEPDRETFSALDIAFDAGRRGGSAPAVMNAADEIAVEAFLQGRIGFLGITEVVQRTLDQVEHRDLTEVAEVIEVDAEARGVASALVSGMC